MNHEIIKTAEYWEDQGDNIRCTLCPQGCLIPPGGNGKCRGRRNNGRMLIANSYGKVTSMAVDPMTKKPLHRFYPQNTILTLASYGCNLHCSFCQNHHISQREADYSIYSPDEVLNLALHHTINDNVGLAFSYNEPTISFEYVKDCFTLIRKAGLKTILVTNGYLNEKPFRELAEITDAMNIDLKGFHDRFYKEICGGDLETVKRNIKIAAKQCHIEITTLVVPGYNDNTKEITEMAKWISDIDPMIPLHLSRFFPRYQMDHLPPTPPDTLAEAADAAAEHLRYIYLGNL